MTLGLAGTSEGNRLARSPFQPPSSAGGTGPGQLSAILDTADVRLSLGEVGVEGLCLLWCPRSPRGRRSFPHDAAEDNGRVLVHDAAAFVDGVIEEPTCTPWSATVGRSRRCHGARPTIPAGDEAFGGTPRSPASAPVLPAPAAPAGKHEPPRRRRSWPGVGRSPPAPGSQNCGESSTEQPICTWPHPWIDRSSPTVATTLVGLSKSARPAPAMG